VDTILQGKGDGVSLYSLHQCEFNKSRLGPQRVKKETSSPLASEDV
jgi:hypothetical protein